MNFVGLSFLLAITMTIDKVAWKVTGWKLSNNNQYVKVNSKSIKENLRAYQKDCRTKCWKDRTDENF